MKRVINGLIISSLVYIIVLLFYSGFRTIDVDMINTFKLKSDFVSFQSTSDINAISISLLNENEDIHTTNLFQSVSAETVNAETVLRTYNEDETVNEIIIPGYNPVDLYTSGRFSLVKYLAIDSIDYSIFEEHGSFILDRKYMFDWNEENGSRTYLVDNFNGEMYSLEAFYEEVGFDQTIIVKGNANVNRNVFFSNECIYYLHESYIYEISFRDEQPVINQILNISAGFSKNVDHFLDFIVDNDGNFLISFEYTVDDENNIGLLAIGSETEHLFFEEVELETGTLCPKLFVFNGNNHYIVQQDEDLSLYSLSYRVDNTVSSLEWMDQSENYDLSSINEVTEYKNNDTSYAFTSKTSELQIEYISISINQKFQRLQLNTEKNIINYDYSLNREIYTIHQEEGQVLTTYVDKHSFYEEVETSHTIAKNNFYFSVEVNDDTNEVYLLGNFPNNGGVLVRVYDSFGSLLVNDFLRISDKNSIILDPIRKESNAN